MNEDYIKGFRKAPDLQLLGRIQARLEKRERRQLIKRYTFLSMLALVFAFGMLMTFSSTVRAEVISIFLKIGGVQYTVNREYPGKDLPEVVLEPEVLSWEEARSRFVSPLELPTYVPEGYEREAEVPLTIWSGDNAHTLEVIWRKKGQYPMIGLFIAQCQEESQGCGIGVGDDGALEEITLNGKPAALIRGAWDVDEQRYDLSSMVSVTWRYDENAFYKLWSFDQDLVDELIKMAESVQ